MMKRGVFLLVVVLSSACYYLIYNVWVCSQIKDELMFYNKGAVGQLYNACFKEKATAFISLHDYISFKQDSEAFNCSTPARNLRLPKPLVALASFQGSGNTWTRLLIETATGIITGSVYKEKIYVGSNECPARGKVEVVKTHNKGYSARSHPDCISLNITRLNFSSAIYILRNPYDALVAEFNRQQSKTRNSKNDTFNSHLGIAGKELFNTTKWSIYVTRGAFRWKEMTLFWMNKRDIQVFLLVYEKLIQNVQLEIMKITKFIGYQMHLKGINCLSGNRTQSYKRTKPNWLTKVTLYNNNLKNIINSNIREVKRKIYRQWNISSLLDSYIYKLA